MNLQFEGTEKYVATRELAVAVEQVLDVGHLGRGGEGDLALAPVGLHGAAAEGREQDVVRLGPVGFARLGGEQAVAADGAHARERAAHSLVEAPLVAKLLHEFRARHEDQRRTHDVELENGAELLGEIEQALDRRMRIERQGVADDRLGRRLRNLSSLGVSHCVSS